MFQAKPENYFAVYFAGGHGTCFDFRENTKLQEIARKIYENNGIVSSVNLKIKVNLNSHVKNYYFDITGVSWRNWLIEYKAVRWKVFDKWQESYRIFKSGIVLLWTIDPVY